MPNSQQGFKSRPRNSSHGLATPSLQMDIIMRVLEADPRRPIKCHRLKGCRFGEGSILFLVSWSSASTDLCEPGIRWAYHFGCQMRCNPVHRYLRCRSIVSAIGAIGARAPHRVRNLGEVATKGCHNRRPLETVAVKRIPNCQRSIRAVYRYVNGSNRGRQTRL